MTQTPTERPPPPKDASARIVMSKRVRYVLVERLVRQSGRQTFQCEYCDAEDRAYNAQTLQHHANCVLR